MKICGKWTKRLIQTAGILLLLCCFPLLSGCNGEEPELTEGITVVNDLDEPYSKETDLRADAAILELLELWYRKSSPLPIIPETAKAEMVVQAAKIRQATTEAGLSKKKYTALLELLEREGDNIINRVYAYRQSNGDVPSSDAVGAIYYDLFGAIGAEAAARLAYRLAVYIYDYKYEKNINRYEQYGYPHLLEEAERLSRERAALTEDVGEENFITVIRSAVMFSELFFGGALEGEGLRTFTDREILLFIRHVRLSELTVGSEGWRVLLSYVSPMLTSEEYEDYGHELLRAAEECGDLDRLAENMPDTVRLLSRIQDSLTEQDVAYIREGKSDALLSSVFAKFEENDWDLLDNLASSIDGGDLYGEVAALRFGEDYTEYAASVTPITLAELRSAADGVSITDSLEKYAAGISPAFSYMMRKDATEPVAE